MKLLRTQIWEVIEHVTIRELIARFEKSGGNIHCMGSVGFLEDLNDPNEGIGEFHESWAWIQTRPPSKMLYVIEYSGTETSVVEE